MLLCRGFFPDALVAKVGASPVCSGASSLWVAILPSLCSSQGTCAKNSASSLHFFVVSGYDVLWWLFMSGKAFCTCSIYVLVVHSVAATWACCAWLYGRYPDLLTSIETFIEEIHEMNHAILRKEEDAATKIPSIQKSLKTGT